MLQQAAAAIQASWRCYNASVLGYNFAEKLRRRWRRLLEPNEAVLLSSPAVWHRNTSLGSVLSPAAGSKRVQLIVAIRVHCGKAPQHNIDDKNESGEENDDGRCRVVLVELDERGSGAKEVLRSMSWPGAIVEIPQQSSSSSGGGGRRFAIMHGAGTGGATSRKKKQKLKRANFTLLVGQASRFEAVAATLKAIEYDQQAILHREDGSTKISAAAPVFRHIIELNLGQGVENMPCEYQGVLEKQKVDKSNAASKNVQAAAGDQRDDGSDDDEDEDDGDGEESNEGSRKGKWQNRFFVLSGGKLRYFLASTARTTEPKGVLKLVQLSNVIHNPMSSNNRVETNPMRPSIAAAGGASASIQLVGHHLGRPHAFRLKLPNGLALEASPPDSECGEEWVDSIRSVIQTTAVSTTAAYQQLNTRQASKTDKIPSSAERQSFAMMAMATDVEEAELSSKHRRRLLRHRGAALF